MQHLPGVDQIFDRRGHVFDWHGRIDTMLVVQIDAVGPEALERFFNDPSDALWPAVQPICAIDLEAELRGDGDLVADWREGFSDQFLVDVGTVYFCGVKKSDASLVRVANHADALGPVHAWPVMAAAKAHVAEAKLRDLQTTQFASLHAIYFVPLCRLRGRRDHPRRCCYAGGHGTGQFQEVASSVAGC